MSTSDQVIKELLGEEVMQQATSELGLQDVPQDIQASLIANIGEGILRRVTLELLTALPEEDRDAFEQLIGGGDSEALRVFLEKRIPDLQEFMRLHAEREYEATKTAILAARAGV